MGREPSRRAGVYVLREAYMAEYANPSAELRARVALEKHRFHNTHSLGQNFLLSERLIGQLLDEAALSKEDCVLEIGPGAGLMTALLSRRCKRVLAVELDRGLEPVLVDVLSDCDNVRVHYGDILKTDVTGLTQGEFGGGDYRVVANLPYYITADILLKLTALPQQPVDICIMVQREAAERIMSTPGSKQWCALAAQLQCYGQPEVLAEVPAEAFDPPPHVTSRFIRIARHETPVVAPKDEQLYRRLIRAAFAMRRKTLANNLKAVFGLDQQQAKAVLSAAGLDERVRGEALDLYELCRVADAICDVTG